ncbi:MAG TPA: SDR family oxidoreductase [Chloroflexota bacterium]
MLAAERVVLITGAAHGIGRALARLLVPSARLALVDLEGDAVSALAAELGGQARALPLQVDVTDRPQVEGMVARTLGAFGRLDALVNCAGGMSGLAHPHRRALETLSPEEWDATFALNVKSVFLCAGAAAPALRAAGGGRIVSVASSAARMGSTTAGPAYVASKAAVIGLTRCLANLLAPEGILVNAVAPGATESERFLAAMAERTPEERARSASRVPLGRHARPEEVAATIAFLLSDGAGYITGATIDVNGGVFGV